ncbi:MAG TPA: hypothetical protein VJJ20_03845 [Candidatus Paceibacterota bacterium]
MRDSLSRLSLLPLGTGLLPLLSLPFVPVMFVQPDLQKTIFAAMLLGLSLVSFAVGVWWTRQRPALSVPLVAYAALGLAVVVVVSATLNGITLTKFFGSGFAVGTGGSFLLFAAAVVFGSYMNIRQARLHYVLYVVAMLAILVLMGVLLPFGVEMLDWLPIKSTLNFPMPYLLGTALLAAAVLSDTSSGRTRWVFAVGAVVLLGGLVLVHQPISTLIVLVSFSLFVLVRGFSLHTKTDVPWLAIGIGVVLGILLIAGFKSPGTSYSFLYSTSASAESTELIGQQITTGSLHGALLGSGPDTFTAGWERYATKQLSEEGERMDPRGVLQGSTSVGTWLATLGFVGVGSYLLCFLVLLGSIWVALMKGYLEIVSNPLFVISALVSLLGLAVSVVDTIGPIQFLLTGVALGVCGRVASGVPAELRPASHWGMALMVPVLFIGLALVALGAAQLVARSFYHRAEYTTNAANSDWYLLRAATLWPMSLYVQKATSAYASSFTDPQYSTTTQFEYITKVQAFTQRAIDKDTTDYRGWVMKAKTLMPYVVLEPTVLGPQVRAALVQAALLAPRRPEIPLLHARLSVLLDEPTEVQQYITQALILKADYPEALQLRSELEAKQAPTMQSQ